MTPERWHKIHEVFDGALQQEPAGREAYLDAACAGDLEMRAEVVDLVAQDALASRDGFLATSEESRPIPSTTAERSRVPADSAGPPPELDSTGPRYASPQFYRQGGLGEVYEAEDQDPGLRREREDDLRPAPIVAHLPSIPGYEILGELGRGGMGVVYKARQLGLQRLVAIKMILGSAPVARFRREAEAVAQLQHPHIVQIHEIGEHDGLPYFSLEFLEGGSLAQKLAETPVSPRQAAELVETLAGAVQAAHERGIIHRDLKPANVLLTTEDVPKISDFGLAKCLDAEADLTQSGEVMGTPSYMAPEQARGKRKQIGPACDVYALGAILYELLTGEPPFRGATAVDTVMQLLSEDPVPPRRLCPKLPRDLEAICLKCLEKRPERRYASAQALANDLHCFLYRQPVRARATGLLGLTWYWARRNPVWAIVIVTVGLGTALGVAQMFSALHRLEQHVTASGRRGGNIPYQILAQEGHVALSCGSLTLVFQGAPDSLVGAKHLKGSFAIPGSGVVWQRTGGGNVWVSSDCDSYGNTITISLGTNDSYQMKLTDLGTRLTIGGQTFDVYGEPRIIRIGRDGTAQ